MAKRTYKNPLPDEIELENSEVNAEVEMQQIERLIRLKQESVMLMVQHLAQRFIYPLVDLDCPVPVIENLVRKALMFTVNGKLFIWIINLNLNKRQYEA